MARLKDELGVVSLAHRKVIVAWIERLMVAAGKQHAATPRGHRSAATAHDRGPSPSAAHLPLPLATPSPGRRPGSGSGGGGERTRFAEVACGQTPAPRAAEGSHRLPPQPPQPSPPSPPVRLEMEVEGLRREVRELVGELAATRLRELGATAAATAAQVRQESTHAISPLFGC